LGEEISPKFWSLTGYGRADRSILLKVHAFSPGGGRLASIQAYMLGWMSYEITGHKADLEGAFIRTQAHTASDALRFAREWAEQGVTGITIVNSKGESFDIDRFGMIVSTNEGRSDADGTSQRR
jgi:hypothetical protein